MPAFSAAAVTRLHPNGLPGEPFGSFSGKTAAAVTSPRGPGNYTWLSPMATPGRKYDFTLFAGKSPAVTSPRGPGNYTWLSPMATPGRKYDFTFFASKTAAATTTVRPFEGLRRHTGRLMH